MPLIRKRRAADPSPSPPPPSRRVRAASVASEDATGADSDGGGGGGSYNHSDGAAFGQMVKKLVRLALACEYSRQPLRRADISAKVLAPNNGRAFKAVFEHAQAHLQQTFGVTMTELPSKDRVTIAQKRAAQRAAGNSHARSTQHGDGGDGTTAAAGASQSQSASSKAYILTSTMGPAYRKLPIIAPARAPTLASEAAYTGFVTFVVSVVYLSQGQRIGEGKLERYLKKCNADEVVLEGERTEKVLKRMEKEGYLVKIRDREAGGEETVDWIVGPRGKVEIAERGVAGLVKGVYGKRGAEVEELEDRLERSLGVGTFRRRARRQEDGEGGGEGEGEGEGEEEGMGEAAEGGQRNGNANGARNGRGAAVNAEPEGARRGGNRSRGQEARDGRGRNGGGAAAAAGNGPRRSGRHARVQEEEEEGEEEEGEEGEEEEGEEGEGEDEDDDE